MIPSIGRTVHYQLTQNDASEIAAARSLPGAVANPHEAGQVVPALIVKVWGTGDEVTEETAVQLQVFVDGNFTIWRTSVSQVSATVEGEEQFGRWSEPKRI